MWPRVSEIVLGCWLVACPAVFGHAGSPRAVWLVDAGAGLAVCALALLSFSRSFRHAHLGTGLLAAGLVIHSYFGPVSAGVQNHILTGLTLLMFSIIPNHANLPPEPRRVW